MKRHVKLPSLFVVLLTIVIISVSATLQRQENSKTPITKLGEPTPIQEGVMTLKQKEHSKIFKGYEWFSHGKKIKDLVAERGDTEVWAPIKTTRRPPPPALSEFLQDLTCKSDAVIVGSVSGGSSNLIESGTFLFTDYEITVKEVLKNNAASPIQVKEVITTTRGGGAVKLNKKIVRAIDPHMGPLEGGKDYLLYLRFIPKTGGYAPLADVISEDTFLIDGDVIAQVSRKVWPIGWHAKATASSFLSEAHDALNSTCEKGEAK